MAHFKQGDGRRQPALPRVTKSTTGNAHFLATNTHYAAAAFGITYRITGDSAVSSSGPLCRKSRQMIEVQLVLRSTACEGFSPKSSFLGLERLAWYVCQCR